LGYSVLDAYRNGSHSGITQVTLRKITSMLGNTIVVDFGTPQVSHVVTLPKINQDGYSSEYRLVTAEGKYTVIIRNSTEKTKVNGLAIDRHQLLARFETSPDEVYPLGRTFEAYSIVRMPAGSSANDAYGPVMGSCGKVIENLPALINWES